MGVVSLIVVVLAALATIASGVWVAVALIVAISSRDPSGPVPSDKRAAG